MFSDLRFPIKIMKEISLIFVIFDKEIITRLDIAKKAFKKSSHFKFLLDLKFVKMVDMPGSKASYDLGVEKVSKNIFFKFHKKFTNINFRMEECPNSTMRVHSLKLQLWEEPSLNRYDVKISLYYV